MVDRGLAVTASFGYWLRRRRLALDLTQVVLAKRVGCATVTIKKIERDERRPSRLMARRLAEELEIPSKQQACFVQIARGERPVDVLPLLTAPVRGSFPRDLGGRPLGRNPGAHRRRFAAHERELSWLEDALRRALQRRVQGRFGASEESGEKKALLTVIAGRVPEIESQLVLAEISAILSEFLVLIARELSPSYEQTAPTRAFTHEAAIQEQRSP